MRVFDAAIAMAISTLFFWLLPGLAYEDGLYYPLLIVAGSLALPAIGDVLGLYQPWRGRSIFTMFGIYALSWLVTGIVISTFLVLTQSSYIYSRLWMGLSALGVLACGLLLRGALYWYLRHLRASGHNLKSVLLIGRPDNIAQVHHRLASMPYVGYRVDREIAQECDRTILDEVRRLAGASSFRRSFDEIWLSYPLSDGEVVKRLADELVTIPVSVRYFPDLSDVRLLNHRMAQVADMFSIDLNYSPLDGPARIVKALEDRLIGAGLLLLFLPVMLVISLAIWVNMGRPILFKQQRHGLDGKRFRIYKFRTMHVQPSSEQVLQARYGDARTTPLGAWLRRTSLDELPQFYNVLQGRMSLVGPRPHAMSHNALYKDLISAYMQRHRVKPGITGWAQVHGLRGITEDVSDMEKRIDYDLYYINNWSLGLDLKILLLTIKRGFVNDKP